MKRLLVMALLGLGVCFATSSCNNGDYDANPKTDYATIKNPMDSSSGVKVLIGTIQATLNGKHVFFEKCLYTIDSAGTYYIRGTVQHDSILHGALEIIVPASVNNGPNEYTFSESNQNGWIMKYTTVDTSYHNRFVLKTYYAGINVGKGSVDFVLQGVEGGNWRGYFNATLYRAALDKDYNFTGQADMTDTAKFENAYYYIGKDYYH